MVEKINRLEKYIVDSSNVEVRDRGKRMAITIDKFGKPTINVATQEATFRIMGTYFYTVEIKNFLDDVECKCSCKSEWEGLCEHQVASLYYLAKYLKENPFEVAAKTFKKETVFRPTKLRKASDPYLIRNFKPFTQQTIFENMDSYTTHRSNAIKVYDFQHSGATLYFEIKENLYYLNQRAKPYRVKFVRKKTGLETTCSCGAESSKLCTHQSALLWHIYQQLGADFFDILEPDYLEKRYKELADQTGISVDSIQDYYSFDIKNRSFVAKSKAVGLVIFKDGQAPVIEAKLKQSIFKKDTFSLPISSFENEKSIAAGFVFSFEDTLGLSIIPITGTPSDSPWLKYINEYSVSNIPLNLDERDETLLSLIAAVKQRTTELWDNRFDLLSDAGAGLQKYYFQKLPQFFSLLKEKPFIYYRPSQFSGKVKKNTITPVTISDHRATLFFELIEEDIFYTLQAKLRLGDIVLNLSDPKLDLSDVLPSFSLVVFKDTLYLQKSLQQSYTIHELKGTTKRPGTVTKSNKPVYKCIKKDFANFFEQIVLPISKNYPIEFDQMKDIENEIIALEPQGRQLYISELSNFILFKPVVAYDRGMNINIREANRMLERNGNQITTFQRDKNYEDAYLEFFINLHPEFEKQRFNEFFFLPFTEMTRNNWFFNIFEQFTEEGIQVFGINDLKTIQYSPYKANISTHIKSGEDWFDVSIEISFGDEVVKLSDVKKAIMKNERFVKLSDGKMGLLPEAWYNKLQKYFRAGEVQSGELKISKMKFSLIDELFDQIDDIEVLQELSEKKRRLREFQTIEVTELPTEIRAELRDYQIEGFNWLNFLDSFQWGGILADDMGLGKTLQILSFLQKQANDHDQVNLVVVPTSLLFNWQNEIKKFVPSLTYLIHHGPERTGNYQDFHGYNLVITTYGLISNDISLFDKVKFNYIVLDESQAIKNPTSKRYKAACLLKSRNKIAMTGTPIENNTFDLYAQINFVNPGFLGSQQSFKEDFSRPIDGDGDVVRAGELQKLIKPFVLRRSKEQVAKELPPKIEDYIYCTMEPEQRKVYDAYRNKYRDYLMNKIEADGLQKSKLFVLEGLLKLRQICDSPELLNDEENYGTESVKITALLKHITEKTGQHKILVFSQFVKMLKLIQRELDKQGVKYEYLDGQCSPKARNASVEHFQTDESCRVFLISLKAGGTGLNLTAADYVYIVDPWWNPAVENQAIDRTHRIGQDKHIIAYRMICKDTVEEKIINYQKKKLKVASDIIHPDESLIKSLTKDDIRELFR